MEESARQDGLREGGQRFGEYEVMRDARGGSWLLGSGSYGTTYKARHLLLGTEAAIKVIRSDVIASESARQRFLSEGRALAKLAHDHIAMLRHFGRTYDGNLYYAMDYCSGGTLAERVRRLGPRPPGEALEIVRQAASALAAAHAEGIVHRDLKPGNLMLAHDPPPLRVKVIDFGLAQASGSGSAGGRFHGTAQWASPEQLREDVLDGRSDLFSLGLVLWFLLQGDAPDQGSTAEVVQSRLASGGYAGRLPQGLPPGIGELIGRLLETDPALRPASANELLANIEALRELYPYEPAAEPGADAGEAETAADGLPCLSGAEAGAERYARLTRLHRDLAGEWFEAELEGGLGMRVVFALDEGHAGNPGLRAKVRANLARLWRQPVNGLPRFVLLLETESTLVAEWEGSCGGDLASWLRLRRKVELGDALGFLAGVAHAADETATCGLPGVGLMAAQVRWESTGSSDGGALQGALPRLFPLLLDASDLPAGAGLAGDSSGSTNVLVGPDLACDRIFMLAKLIYRILAGREIPDAVAHSQGAYVAVSSVSEKGNAVLREALGRTGPRDSCLSLLRALAHANNLSIGGSSTGRSRSAASGSQSALAVHGPSSLPSTPVPIAPLPPPLPPALPLPSPARRKFLPGRKWQAAGLWATLGLVALTAAGGVIFGISRLIKRLPAQKLSSAQTAPVAAKDSRVADEGKGPAKQDQAAKPNPFAAATAGPGELRNMARAGDPLAQALLGDALCWGSPSAGGVGGDPAEGVQWIGKSADAGHPLGRCLMGFLRIGMNGAGKWVPRDEEAARRDFTEAIRLGLLRDAENGGVMWCNKVGIVYLEGRGLPADPAKGVEWFRKAAERGLANAQCNLGSCYLRGTGVEKDQVEAVRWYRKAAGQGFALAQDYLGYCIETGLGAHPDPAEAVKWYRKAAEQGFASAQYKLGNCCFRGAGVNQDQAEAARWYREAAEQGFADAQSNLGFCYQRGLGVARDQSEAVKWFRKAAGQGHAPAQNALGLCYSSGQGVSQSHGEALKWYRMAAGQGYADAQFHLGYCYQNGLGLNKDQTGAAEWFRKAAGQGHAEAQDYLGYCLQKGLGVRQDQVEAVKWYRKAAAQGLADALNNLGYCQQFGIGMHPDPAEAVKWYSAAAEQGLALAQVNLGYCHQKGIGVRRDQSEAIKWYRKAADQGFALAEYDLGYCYLYGIGVHPDQTEALKWFCKAAAQGNTMARDELRRRFGR